MAREVEEAIQVLQEQIRTRIECLEAEIVERQRAIESLRSVQTALPIVPLWEDRRSTAQGAAMVVRDDEFGHLSMSEAAVEVLGRAGRPLHAKDIWFAVMRGGYPHHSPTSYQSLVTCLGRMRSRFNRVGPSIFALTPAAESERLNSKAAQETNDASYHIHEGTGSHVG